MGEGLTIWRALLEYLPCRKFLETLNRGLHMSPKNPKWRMNYEFFPSLKHVNDLLFSF